MKKLIFSSLFIFAALSSGVAQDFSYSFGLKGGVNYSLGGYLEESVPEGDRFDAQSKIGFHGGAFVQANLGKLFLRPELVYTSIQTEYELRSANTTHSVTKIDLPLLIGYNIAGPLDVYAGPVYSNIMDSEIETGPEGETYRPVVQDSPGVNLNLGAKVEFGRIGVDLRYEHTLTSVDNLTPQPLTFDGAADGNYGVGAANFSDPRINQIILSVTFKLFGSDLGGGRRTGGCY